MTKFFFGGANYFAKFSMTISRYNFIEPDPTSRINLNECIIAI